MSKSRLTILMCIVVLVFSVLAGRLFYYQVINGEAIAKKAIAMRTKDTTLKESNRGDILDRNLLPLTNARISSTVYCLPGYLYNDIDQNDAKAREAARFLAKVLNSKNEKEILAEIIDAAKKRAAFSCIASNLTTDQVNQINSSNLSGIVVAPVTKRYREDGFCAHLLGYINSGASEGLTGMELAYNDVLKASKSGQELVSVSDARGKVIPGLMFKVKNEQHDSQGSVVLTIDKHIQEAVEESMNKSVNKGAVVVMDIKSRDILAMASRPTFDPSQLEKIINYDNRSPLINRALSKYNPGSLFKIAVSTAALQEKVVQMDDIFNCKGKYIFSDNLAISCWKEEGHGDISFVKGFANSCNPTFIEVGLRLGRMRLLHYVDLLHLTDETITGYKYGPSGSYVKIDGGDPAMGNACLGQEGVMLTPVEIASLICTVADNGQWRPPSLVLYTLDKQGNKNIVDHPDKIRVIDTSTATKVKNLMEEVINEGTGKTAGLQEVKIAGKTATSQTGKMLNEDEEVLNTWFAGYFPVDNPRWAIVVLVEEGSSGAQNAAPVFKDIVKGILEYNSITQ